MEYVLTHIYTFDINILYFLIADDVYIEYGISAVLFVSDLFLLNI